MKSSFLLAAPLALLLATATLTESVAQTTVITTQPVPVRKKKGWSRKAKGTVIGAGAGAATGAVIGGGKGAIIGGVVGAAAGGIIGRNKDKKKDPERYEGYKK